MARAFVRHRGLRASLLAANLPPTRPVPLVLLLPGLGGEGRGMATVFSEYAEDQGWLLVAPTPVYDPPPGVAEMMSAADQRVDDGLVAALDWVRQHGPRSVSKIAVVGFSRGAQSAHRFALRHPDQVVGVVALSAGTYTLPSSTAAYPLGMGGFASANHGVQFDLSCFASVHAFVGVGAEDRVPGDVVREWDAIEGTNRLDRAGYFAAALGEIGVDVHLQIFPGVAHALSSDMIAESARWLAQVFGHDGAAQRCQ